MKIMSLNAWGGALHAPLVAYIREIRPDILCLQEVAHSPGSPRAWLDYRDGDLRLPQRANLFAEVARSLPEHLGLFCPAAQGPLWDGEVEVSSQFGLASFVHGRLAVSEQLQAFVHKSFGTDGFGEHPRARNAHLMRIFVPDLASFVVVAQMHGLRDLSGKGDTPERIAQAEKLKAMVATVARPGDSVIVCGDFNVEPESATFGILGRLGLTDLVTARGFQGTRTDLYRKQGRYADYMLVSQDLSDCSFDVVTELVVSDHCALLLEIDETR